MSETIDRELRILVERVVRPLPLTLVRQKRLRTELLEHLRAIYAEELAKDADPAQALAHAAERFGKPSELTAELLNTIGWPECLDVSLERLAGQRYGESIDRYVLRMLACFLCFVIPLFAFVIVAKYFHRQETLTWLELRLVTGTILCFAIWFGGFLWCGLHWGQAWLPPRKSWKQILVWSMGLCLIWPISLWILIHVTGGDWADYGRLKFTVSGTVSAGVFFSLLVGIVVGICHQRDMAYRREWAKLEVEAT